MKTKLRNMQWLVLGFFMVSGYCGLAQESLKSIQKLQDENKVTSYLMNKDRNTPYLVKFDGLSTQTTHLLKLVGRSIRPIERNYPFPKAS